MDRCGLFTIAVRRDCKFIKNGTPAGEQILRKGARVRVSYFATTFTGKIAVKIESNTAPGVRPVSFYRGSTRSKRARLSLLQAIADEYKKTT